MREELGVALPEGAPLLLRAPEGELEGVPLKEAVPHPGVPVEEALPVPPPPPPIGVGVTVGVPPPPHGGVGEVEGQFKAVGEGGREA